VAKKDIERILKYMETCLKDSGLNISKVVLFGSHSKKTATIESDIDIVIISKDFEGKNIFERASITKDAEIKTIKRFLVPLDILTMTPWEWKEKKQVYVQ